MMSDRFLKQIEKYFVSGINIMKITQQDNGIGGFIDTEELVLEIPAKIRPLSGDEKLSADKLTLFATHKMYCKNLEINQTEDITYFIKDTNYNKKYEIVFISNMMLFDELWQIDLKEVY